jgi:tetratricopeptide (TPR) repeat protein
LFILSSEGTCVTPGQRTPICCVDINTNSIAGVQANSAEFWFNEGNALYAQSEYEEAVKAFDSATELNPQYTYAWINKGEILLIINKQREAVNCFNKAIELNPYNYIPWYYKAIALLDGGGNDFVSPSVFKLDPKLFTGNSLDIAAKLNPELTNAACFWYYKGREHNRDADMNAVPGSNSAISLYNSAIEAFDKAIEIDPNFKEAWGGKAYSLHELGKDYSEAYKRALGASMPAEYRVFL